MVIFNTIKGFFRINWNWSFNLNLLRQDFDQCRKKWTVFICQRIEQRNACSCKSTYRIPRFGWIREIRGKVCRRYIKRIGIKGIKCLIYKIERLLWLYDWYNQCF